VGQIREISRSVHQLRQHIVSLLMVRNFALREKKNVIPVNVLIMPLQMRPDGIRT